MQSMKPFNSSEFNNVNAIEIYIYKEEAADTWANVNQGKSDKAGHICLPLFRKTEWFYLGQNCDLLNRKRVEFNLIS